MASKENISLPKDTVIRPVPSPRSVASRYSAELPPIPKPFYDVLTKYSKIPPNDVAQHMLAIQRKGWEIHSYPCIGRWYFMRLSLLDYPQWEDVLKAVKNGGVFLDVGAFMAVEVRALASRPGVDPKLLFALDLAPEFLELGFECFRDADRLVRDNFIAADFFDDADDRVKALRGKAAVVHAGAFLHLFTLEKATSAVCRMIELGRQQKGTLILGRVLGRREAAHVMYKDAIRTLAYRHNWVSMKKMWEDAAERTGTKWDVWTKQRDIPREPGKDEWLEPDSVVVVFCARRLS